MVPVEEEEEEEEERIGGKGLERRERSRGRMRRGDEDVGVERVGTCVCETREGD